MALVGPRKTRKTPGTELELYTGPPVSVTRQARSPRDRKSSILSITVMALVVPGLFATVALPAYAFQQGPDTQVLEAQEQLQELKTSGAQSITVAESAATTAASRDTFGATTPEELAAAAAEAQRAELAAAYTYSGPTVSDFLANPPYPSFDLASLASVALQYQGVPYVYGGADPSGFDCSGFVMYVYAQFGISLPHSVTGTAAMGTAISNDAALPGDIVIMDGHNGIYMGNGMILDAPDVGRSVMMRPIWTSDYYIVRIGI